MTDEEISEILARVDKILDGIDRDEIEYEKGWWETSTGQEFGEARLKELKDFLTERLRG